MKSFNLSRIALENGPITRFFLIVLLVIGSAAFFALGQDEDPPFTMRFMAMRVFWPGATTTQVAQMVTQKIELALEEVPYYKRSISNSRNGEATIIVELRDTSPQGQTDALWYQLRKRVNDMIQRGGLPDGVIGPFYIEEFSDMYGTIFALSGKEYSYRQLKDQADAIRTQLIKNPLISKVEFFGVQDEKIYIEFSQAKMTQMGLGIQGLMSQLSSQNNITGSGQLVTDKNVYVVSVTGTVSNIDQLRNMPIAVNGRVIRLSDIATVRRTYSDPSDPMMRFNGKDVIGIGISMVKGGNIVTLGKNLEKQLASLRNNLPIGMQIETMQEQATVVKNSVNEFVKALAEAVLIVLLVSFIALGLKTRPFRIDFRPGLVVAASIPLVLSITFLVMYMSDLNLHKVSLGALIISLGLLVDDAIIAVEMMIRKLEEGASIRAAAVYAYDVMAMPMLSGTIITALGFLPIGLNKTKTGEFTFSLFAVTAIALLTSWLVSVYFTPYIGSFLLKEKSTDHHEVFDTPFYRGLRSMLDWCLRLKWVVIAVTLAVLACSLYAFKFVKVQFFPNSDRPEILAKIQLQEGSSIAQSRQTIRDIEQWILQDPRTDSVVSVVGGGLPRFFLSHNVIFPQSHVSELLITPKRIEDRDSLLKSIEHRLHHNYPYLRARTKLLSVGPPVDYPFSIRITGPDHLEVHNIAQKIWPSLIQESSLKSFNNNWGQPVQVVRVAVDQDKARQVGTSTAFVAQSMQVMLSGIPIGQYKEGDQLIRIMLRAQADERNTLNAIRNIRVGTAFGTTVPLSQVANVQLVWEPAGLWREKREYALTLGADVMPNFDVNSEMLRFYQKIEPVIKNIPSGYTVSPVGNKEESDAANTAIAEQLPLCLFLIFTLLMLQLKNFSRALLVFLTGPLGLIGAVWILLITGKPMGFVAYLGIIALFGMIVRNSIILIDNIEESRSQGIAPWDAVIGAAIFRFRPIMLTAAAAVLAMIPLSRSTFWGPMAIAIMGGLIVATVLTIIVLPALYAAWFRVKPVQRVRS